MEVVAAEPAGDVDNFADEVEARDATALHGFGVELVGGDAAGRDFGFGEALGAGGDDAPGVEFAFEVGERGVGGFGGFGYGWVQTEPAVGEALRERGAEGERDGGVVAAGGAIAGCGEERGGDVSIGGEVEFDGFAGTPVGGDLQDGGAAESAVGDQHVFPEGDACGLTVLQS